MPIDVLLKGFVIVVVYFTAFMFSKDALADKKKAIGEHNKRNRKGLQMEYFLYVHI